MYSLQKQYNEIVFHFTNQNVGISTKTLLKSQVCSSASTNNAVFEAFQDSLSKEPRHAEEIFCKSLSGTLIEFPKSLEDLWKVNNYTSDLLKRTGLTSVTTVLNAKSVSKILPEPEMRFDEESLNVYHMKSEPLQEVVLEPAILKLLSKRPKAYQVHCA